MAKDSLRELFHEKKQRAEAVNVDWAAKRDAWIQTVKDLYRKIEDDFLSGTKGEIEIARTEKTVIEAYIGEYRIPELILRVGDEQATFSPVGVNVVGAKGRIDLHGDRGEATIVWRGEDQWSIVISRVPSLRLVPLTAESLAEILKGIMRP
jgi:hypothetical protein